MSIDVGAPCIDRSSGLGDYTLVGIDNPANASGTIDYICIYALSTMSSIEVASFIDEGSNVLSTNGVVALVNSSVGENTYNAPGDFTAFNISAGEYIGIKYIGSIEVATSGGGGVWYKAGDNIPASSVTFSWIANYIFSLYATGTEAAPPPTFIPQITMF